MRRICKAIVSLTLVLSLLAGLFCVGGITASAAVPSEETFLSKINSLKQQYPDGKYWNDYNGRDSEGISKAGNNICPGNYKGTPCTQIRYCGGNEINSDGCTCACGYYVGHQCFGFANLMAYKTMGSYATTTHLNTSGTNTAGGWKAYTSVSEFFAGDVVRINNYRHSIFIFKVVGDTVYYVDCNASGPCQINWDNVTTTQTLKGKVSYVVRMNGSTLKGTGSPLTTPTISFDKSSYTMGDTITVSWALSPSDSNLSHYWIVVYDPDGNECFGGKIDKSQSTYSFATPGVGTYSVKLFATPTGSVSGEGSLTDTKTITVNVADTTPPTISNVTIFDLDETGYLITAEIWDDIGVEEVYFPTWTAYNDQDDIAWFKGTVSGSTVTFRMNTFDHNDETGLYFTDIYVYDTSGNRVYYHVEVNVPAPDTTPPTITKLSFYDVDETGYSIKVTFSDNVGVTRVACPSWTEANGQDDLLWKDAVIDGNTATFRVNVADHNHELGTYITDVYVYDASGNRVTSDWVWVYVTALSAPIKTVTWNGHIYAFYETYRSWTTAKDMCEQLGGHLATITSAEEQAFLQNHAEGKGYWIGATDEKEEGQWEWVTGEAWNYTAWANNQPDNAVSNEHYVHLMTSGEWNDIHHESNADKIGFILEIDPEESVPGDVNGDGEVTAFDALNVLRDSNGQPTITTEDQRKAADVNGDGEVTAFDALMILRHANGVLDSLG